jgi:hypothetical protein
VPRAFLRSKIVAFPVRTSGKPGQKRDKKSAEFVRTAEQHAAFTRALKLVHEMWFRTNKAMTTARKTTAFANAMNDAAADLKLNAKERDAVDDRTVRTALSGERFPQERTFQCMRRVLFPGVTDGCGDTAEDDACRAFTALWRGDATPQDEETIARWCSVPTRKEPSLSDDSPPEFGINWKQTRARPFDDELVHFRLHPPLPSNQPGDRHDILATLDFGTIERTADSGTVVLALRAAHLNVSAASYQVAMNKMPGEEGNAIPGFTKKAGGAIIRPPAA